MAAVAMLAYVESNLLCLVNRVGGRKTPPCLAACPVALRVIGKFQAPDRSLADPHHFPGDAAMGFFMGANTGEEPVPASLQRRRRGRSNVRKGVGEIERSI